jgi:hypothetical protein
MEVKDWRFPMACPKCEAMTGFPFRLVTEAMITAEMRCRSCRIEWVLSAPVPSFLVRRKKDLRETEPPKP